MSSLDKVALGKAKRNEEKLGSGGFNIAGKWTSQSDPITGEGFVAKSTDNSASSVIGWQHASATGYLLHFEARDGMANPAAMIGIGLDRKAPDGGLGGTGILISNKVGAYGLVVTNGAGNNEARGYGIFGQQQSTAAPLIRGESWVAGGAPLLELAVFAGTPTTTQKLARFITAGNHLAGDISAYDGEFRWIDKTNLRNTQVNTTLNLRNSTGAGAPAKLVIDDPFETTAIVEASVLASNKSNAELTFYRPTGSGTYWARRVVAEANIFKIQGAGAAAKGSETWNTLIGITDTALGFYGAVPVTKPTSVAVTAEGIHAALVKLGLIS